MVLDYKKLYVDQFYYADVTKIIRLNDSSDGHHPEICTKPYQNESRVDTISNESNPIFIPQEKNTHRIYTIINYVNTETNKDKFVSRLPGSPQHLDPVYIYAKALRRPLAYRPPAVFKLTLSSFSLFRQSQSLSSQPLDEETTEEQNDRSVSQKLKRKRHWFMVG